MKFIWARKTGTYQTGCNLYLNKIRVAGYTWNSSRSQGNPKNEPDWAGYIDLPSLKNASVSGDTEGEIKTKIERVVTDWFNRASK